MLIKKYIYIVILCFIVILSGCNRVNSQDIIVEESIEEINFTDIWEEIRDDKLEKAISNGEFQIKVTQDNEIEEIRLQFIVAEEKRSILKELIIEPSEESYYITKGYEIGEFNEPIVEMSELLLAVDTMNLNEFIDMAVTKGDYYNIELFSFHRKVAIITNNIEYGKYQGKEVNLETGNTREQYNYNRFIILNNEKQSELHYNESYNLENNALEFVIVPMEKTSDNSFAGSIEMTIIYLLN